MIPDPPHAIQTPPMQLRADLAVSVSGQESNPSLVFIGKYNRSWSRGVEIRPPPMQRGPPPCEIRRLSLSPAIREIPLSATPPTDFTPPTKHKRLTVQSLLFDYRISSQPPIPLSLEGFILPPGEMGGDPGSGPGHRIRGRMQRGPRGLGGTVALALVAVALVALAVAL